MTASASTIIAALQEVELRTFRGVEPVRGEHLARPRRLTGLSVVAQHGTTKAEGPSALKKYWYLIDKNISGAEARPALSNPTKIVRWLGVHKDVYKETGQMTDAEMQNSIRHAYWQCLLKRRLGEDFAEQLAEAHEEAFPGSDADSKADAANNILGLELADQVKTDKECRERVHEMWEAGLLATRHDYE